MKFIIGSLLLTLMLSCDKVISVKLPAYEPEIVVEMYLEDGKPLRCLLSESLPYTDTVINRPLNNARVVFSDGSVSDTLQMMFNEDTVTGRWYNYYHPGILLANTNKTYSIMIQDSNNRVVTGTTRFSEKFVTIDSVDTKRSAITIGSFSVGVVISDPPNTENYYRFFVSKKLSDYRSDPSDFFLSDISFNGKPFSFFSEAQYAANDTITIRVYTLQKEHFDYIRSTDDARNSNFNPFSQPGRIKSNVKGGLGIFTTLRYDQRKVIVK